MLIYALLSFVLELFIEVIVKAKTTPKMAMINISCLKYTDKITPNMKNGIVKEFPINFKFIAIPKAGNMAPITVNTCNVTRYCLNRHQAEIFLILESF